MKRTFTCVLLLVLSGIVRFCYAQTKISSLQGKVVNETLTGADAATVALMRLRDSSYVQSTVSNKNGFFQFTGLKPDKYILQVTKTGYHKIYSGPFLVTNNKTINADTLKLLPSQVNLSEVIVTDKRKYLEIRPDKTTINLDHGILASGSSVMGVLATAPGVKINSSGDVFLRAGQKATIFVNGKQVRLEGDDLASYLQSMQAADVEQVELITNPPARYDAVGTGGVINIILRKGKNVGFNGNTTLNADYGKFGRAGAAFSGNYRSQNINIFGGIGYRYVKTDHTINNLRNVDGTDITTFDTHYYNTQSTPTLDYRVGADFFISPKHTIGFLVKGTDETARFNKQTNTEMLLNGARDSVITTLSNLKRDRNQINYNINYAGTLGNTRQTLSADLDLSIYNRHSYEDIVSLAVPVSLAQPMGNPPYHNDTLMNDAPTRIVNRSARIDYTTPFTKNGKLEAGIKASYVKSDNTQYFTSLTNNTYQPVSMFTNQFIYTESKQAAYANFTNSGTKLSYNVGLRVERTSSDANSPLRNHQLKRDFTNLFPTIQIGYNLGNEQQLTFDYNRRMTPPAYESLNPIIAYQDNYNYRMGNSYLKPEYADYFQIAYTNKSNFSAALYASTVSDFFDFSYFIQNDSSKVLITTKRNLKRENNFGAKFNIPLQVTKWWNVNFNPDISVYQFKDYAGSLNKWSKDIVLDLNQDFTITKTIAATVYAHYESDVFYGLYNNSPVFYLNPGISKQVFDKAGSITLSVSDLFNTQRDKYRVDYQNLDFRGYDKVQTRMVHLTFVYNFGKRTVKGSRKRNVGNNDEQKRMNGN
ncbi:outer membrane beta-barrel protein [Mucilaginibacter agri]|uniref:TonB-dependent receptor n=1 Tax=Mucilaginibacter agri TaxID=2695265 RepID=A0A965ZJS3_9SPHI|nr:outer membrane beta-barrel protein [Mucilaginibacter agri]NCD71337.1 TonB-dependent receptor [Mucilaginibacter agri]